MTDNPNDAVPPGCECPLCGENEHDRLIWIDDDTLRCTMCGAEYQPG
ncbi:MAG: hypothetical protein AB7K24_20640 [Gemmataceae bacterium]